MKSYYQSCIQSLIAAKRVCPKLVTGCLLLAIVLTACVKAVKPEYRFRDGFLLVDGKLSDVAGKSEVSISEARLNGAIYQIETVDVAQVSSIDDEGNEVSWNSLEDSDTYRPPSDFRGQPGREYYLRIVDQAGQVFASSPEKMPQSVALDNLRSSFAQEAYYNSELQRFVPAFRLLASFNDPETEGNYYRFTYLSWEKLIVCVSCNFGQFDRVLGECVSTPQARFVERYDYGCLGNCWERTFYPDFGLLSDEFINGNAVNELEVGRINYDWYGNILIIVSMEQLSADAHAYNRVLREQSLGSGGLNATLPAALDGNVDALTEGERSVLGYFAVVSTVEDRVFFDRDTVNGIPLPFDGDLNFDIPPPPAAAYVHPCEGPNRSSIRPTGWPE